MLYYFKAEDKWEEVSSSPAWTIEDGDYKGQNYENFRKWLDNEEQEIYDDRGSFVLQADKQEKGEIVESWLFLFDKDDEVVACERFI